MKYSIFISLFVALFVLACDSPSKEEKAKFSITCTISDIPTGNARLYNVRDFDLNLIDSVEISDGKFIFTGILEEPEMLYMKVNEERDLLKVFAENTDMTVEASAGEFSLAVINGSALNDAVSTFTEGYRQKRQMISSMFSLYEGSRVSGDTTGLSQKLEGYKNAQLDFHHYLQNFVADNSTNVLGPYVVSRYLASRLSVSSLDSVMETFSSEVKSSIYAEQLQSKIDKIRLVEIGQTALDFTLNDPEGNPVSLSSFKGKFLLVDFWASWCAPCRKENPNVVKMKQKFADNDFEILGVSMDSDKDAWLKAIKDDQLEWTHVSDLKGWKCEAGELYNVKSIPHTILIDKQGVIIAKNLKGEALESKLEELFKGEV